jgi:hypothetical protein
LVDPKCCRDCDYSDPLCHDGCGAYEHELEIAIRSDERERLLPFVEKAKTTQLELFRKCWDKNIIELVKQVGMDIRAIEEYILTSPTPEVEPQ